MDGNVSQIDEQFLVLLYENVGVLPLYERWDLGMSALSQGKLIFWYADKLNIGTKTLLKRMWHLEELGLIERRDGTRDRSSIIRYVLTKKGLELAIQIKTKCEVECCKSPENCYIKVLTKTSRREGIEQPLFALRKENILSIENVTVKKESAGDSEFVITRGDTLIVTVKKDRAHAIHEIVIKGLTYDVDSFEKAKRYALVILQQKGGSNGHRVLYTFVPLAPLPDSYFSRKISSQQKTKRLLKEWKGHNFDG